MSVRVTGASRGVCCAFVCGVLSLSAEGWAAGGAKLSVARGQVFVTAPGGSEGGAREGQDVVPGSRLRTGADSSAEVTFEDGSLLKMQAASQITLSGNKRQQEKNSVVLFFGRIWSKVAKADTGEKNYEVKTPNAVCGVRGTEFETAVADDGSVRVRVSEGAVGVADEGGERNTPAGQEVGADEKGVAAPQASGQSADWNAWQEQKRQRLDSDSKGIVGAMKGKIMSRKDKLESLRARQKDVEGKRKQAQSRAKSGDGAAAEDIKKYNSELAQIADAIADLGDQAESQFGFVDHLADLANDPRFKNIDRKYLAAEAASLRRIKAMFDQMVKEGTDISIEAMDNMMKDMRDGKRGTLKDKKSAGDDLFGGDDGMDMK